MFCGRCRRNVRRYVYSMFCGRLEGLVRRYVYSMFCGRWEGLVRRYVYSMFGDVDVGMFDVTFTVCLATST